MFLSDTRFPHILGLAQSKFLRPSPPHRRLSWAGVGHSGEHWSHFDAVVPIPSQAIAAKRSRLGDLGIGTSEIVSLSHGIKIFIRAAHI